MIPPVSCRVLPFAHAAHQDPTPSRVTPARVERVKDACNALTHATAFKIIFPYLCTFLRPVYIDVVVRSSPLPSPDKSRLSPANPTSSEDVYTPDKKYPTLPPPPGPGRDARRPQHSEGNCRCLPSQRCLRPQRRRRPAILDPHGLSQRPLPDSGSHGGPWLRGFYLWAWMFHTAGCFCHVHVEALLMRGRSLLWVAVTLVGYLFSRHHQLAPRRRVTQFCAVSKRRFSCWRTTHSKKAENTAHLGLELTGSVVSRVAKVRRSPAYLAIAAATAGLNTRESVAGRSDVKRFLPRAPPLSGQQKKSAASRREQGDKRETA